MKHFSAVLGLLITGIVQAQVTHDIHVIDYEFVPPTLTIAAGDAIHVIFDDNGHTFTQVSQATWAVNDNTPLPGGFDYDNEVTFTPTGLGTIYYVCVPHADDGMKGTIEITGTIDVADVNAAGTIRFAPNPARDRIHVLDRPGIPITVEFYDAAGRQVMSAVPTATSGIDVSMLPPGNYQMVVRDADAQVLARERMVIVH